jgi:hypothetical protein
MDFFDAENHLLKYNEKKRDRARTYNVSEG